MLFFIFFFKLINVIGKPIKKPSKPANPPTRLGVTGRGLAGRGLARVGEMQPGP